LQFNDIVKNFDIDYDVIEFMFLFNKCFCSIKWVKSGASKNNSTPRALYKWDRIKRLKLLRYETFWVVIQTINWYLFFYATFFFFQWPY